MLQAVLTMTVAMYSEAMSSDRVKLKMLERPGRFQRVAVRFLDDNPRHLHNTLF